MNREQGSKEGRVTKNPEILLADKIEKIVHRFSDFNFLLFSFGIISIISFLIVYSFLYGYYFGGAMEKTFTNFNIISSFIPFDVRTISMVTFYFLCIFYTVTSVLFILKTSDKKKPKGHKLMLICLIVLVSVILNLFLSIFFLPKVTMQGMLSFYLIWIMIGLILLLCFIAIKLKDDETVVLYSAVMLGIYCLTINIFSKYFNDTVLTKDYNLICIVLLLPSFALLNIYCYRKKIVTLINYLPFISIFILTVFYLNLSIHIKIVTIIFLLILVFIFKKFLKYINNMKLRVKDIIKKEEITNGEREANIIYKFLKMLYLSLIVKNDQLAKFMLSITLLAIFLITPQISMSVGKAIRTINVSHETNLKLTFVNYSGVTEPILMNYYIDNESILYISNEKWELEILKPINYHVTSSED